MLLKLVPVELELVGIPLVTAVGITALVTAVGVTEDELPVYWDGGGAIGESVRCINPLPNRAPTIRTRIMRTARYLVRFQAGFPFTVGDVEGAVSAETST